MLSPWMAHGNVHDYIASNGFVEDEVHRIVRTILGCYIYIVHVYLFSYGKSPADSLIYTKLTSSMVIFAG